MEYPQPTNARPSPTNVEKEVTSIDLIVSKSDKEGMITYSNPIFAKISGYNTHKLLGEPHSILRHPDMPKVIFKYLWDTVSKGHDVSAYVKNLCSDGSYYWVLATVKMAKNQDGTFRNYMSTRKCITNSAKATIGNVYASLLALEKGEGGLEASQNALDEFLSSNQIIDPASFNGFMLSLNK